MSNPDFDVCVIGGGQAGLPLSSKLADAGLRVVVIERKNLGGSCLNFGCTPTKAVIASARIAHLARRASEYGIEVPTVKVDFPAVMARARRIVAEWHGEMDPERETMKNPGLIRGQARIVGRGPNGFQVSVGDTTLTAAQIVLNVGTRRVLPPIPGLETVPGLLHSDNWIDSDELPAHLAILGGGYIGMEMGQFYRRMGSEVTIIDHCERVLDQEDADVSGAMRDVLAREGVRFRMNTEVERVDGGAGDGTTSSGIVLYLKAGGKPEMVTVSHLFVATGRKPNTDDLGLDAVGVEKDDKGSVKVDERLATNVEGIWAAGDVRGGPMFTHAAKDDARILASQMIGDKSRTTKRLVPYAVYTDPELAHVGMRETDAKASGREIAIARFALKDNGKAIQMGETEGFLKVIADKGTKKLLGVTMLGVEAAELMHVFIDLMNADAPYTAIRDAIHIHPTLAEGLQDAVTCLDD